MPFASVKLKPESASDDLREYAIMLAELEEALQQISNIRSVLESAELNPEAAIKAEAEKSGISTPKLGREEEIAIKIEQSLTNIIAKLETAASEQEFERILSAADEYLQILMGKLGKSTNRKLLEKLFVLETTLQAVRQQLEQAQKTMREKPELQNNKQQNILQNLQKDALKQILDNALNNVRARIKDITQKAILFAEQNARLSAQKQQILNAQNVQIQLQTQRQNLNFAQRMQAILRSMLETRKIQPNKINQPDAARKSSLISQLISNVSERARNLIKPAQEVNLATQKIFAAQAILTAPLATQTYSAEASAKTQIPRITMREFAPENKTILNQTQNLGLKNSITNPAIFNPSISSNIANQNSAIDFANKQHASMQELKTAQETAKQENIVVNTARQHENHAEVKKPETTLDKDTKKDIAPEVKHKPISHPDIKPDVKPIPEIQPKIKLDPEPLPPIRDNDIDKRIIGIPDNPAIKPPPNLPPAPPRGDEAIVPIAWKTERKLDNTPTPTLTPAIYIPLDACCIPNDGAEGKTILQPTKGGASV